MPNRIDHVVVVVDDLDRAVTDATRAGFTVTPGGQHTGGITHNALIPFADGSYVELIAFLKPDQGASHKWWPRLQRGEALVDFALLSNDLATEAREINARGLPVEEPTDNGRLRPDGERLAWRAIQTQKVIGESGLPFLIEDVTARTLRVPSEARQTTHPNGATGLAGVTVVVADMSTGANRFAHLLGTPGTAEPDAPAELGGARIFPIGQQWIELIDPIASSALADVEPGPFKILLRAGDGPVGPRDGELIDLALMHGARFRLARSTGGE